VPSVTKLPSPRHVLKRVEDVDKLLKGVSGALARVKLTQVEHAKSLSELGRLLETGNLQSAPWCKPAIELLHQWESESEQGLAASEAVLPEQPFADFQAHNLRAASTRALGYEQSYKAHTDEKKKVDGKPEKRKLPALQQAEREAFRSWSCLRRISRQ